MVITCSKEFIQPQESIYETYFNSYKFPLSDFQKWAIYSIVKGDHCLVTAHTGSGKTLPAEFAIEYFKSKNKKIIKIEIAEHKQSFFVVFVKIVKLKVLLSLESINITIYLNFINIL